MLILDGASENKLTELVKASEELILERILSGRKIIPDRAALIWCAIDGEIAKGKTRSIKY